MNRGYTLITAVLFTIIFVLHLARIAYGWEVIMGSFEIPMWFSWGALFISGALAYNGWKLSR